MNWIRAGKKIEVPLVEYLEALFKEEFAKGNRLNVSVGTDSQRNGRGYKFATVILIRVYENLGGNVTVGRGGKMLSSTYHLKTYAKNKEGVNERMLIEVGKSIEIAMEINELLEKYKIKMEIHADINPSQKHESNKAMSEAIGYIMGMGFDYKIKPYSFASSYCADKYAK